MLKPLFTKKSKHKTNYNIVGFDIETHGKENDFYMGGIYDDNGYKAYYNINEYRTALLSEKYANSNTLVFATNLGFDMKVFENSIYYNKIKRMERGSSLIQATYKQQNNRNDQETTFLDTMNIAPMSLEKLGNIIGVQKLQTPVCIVNDGKEYARLPKTLKEYAILEKYNERDCEVTKKFIEFFQESMNKLGGRLKPTIASTALDLYQRQFLRFPITHEKLEIDANEFLFKAYAGGRTETYIRGKVKGKIKGFDVNSLYPSMMRQHYPLPSSAKYLKKENDKYLLYEGVSECKIECPPMKYPLLFKKHDKKLIFPTGRFTGRYTHEELREAVKLGYKVKAIETIYYTKNFYPFRNYVETLYAKRLEYQEENNPMVFVVKLLLNSLYGKFGSRHITTTEFINLNNATREDAIRFHTNNKCVINEKTGYAYIYGSDKCLSNYVFPIFALSTTAKARIHMHRYMRNLEVYYQDTDSLYIKGDLPTGNALGEMKLEYEGCAEFIRPKMYKLDNKVKAKGLPKANDEDFKAILKREEIKKISFIKPKTAIRKGRSTGSIATLTKKFSLEDTKRVWEKELYDGSEQVSLPLHLEEF